MTSGREGCFFKIHFDFKTMQLYINFKCLKYWKILCILNLWSTWWSVLLVFDRWKPHLKEDFNHKSLKNTIILLYSLDKWMLYLVGPFWGSTFIRLLTWDSFWFFVSSFLVVIPLSWKQAKRQIYFLVRVYKDKDINL